MSATAVFRSFKGKTADDVDRELRTLMALFPDRETFDQWADARGVSPEQRAHMVARAPWGGLDDEKDDIGG